MPKPDPPPMTGAEKEMRLAQAIHRGDPTYLDGMDLEMNGNELKRTRNRLTAMWILDKLRKTDLPDLTDIIKIAHGGNT